MKFFMLLTGIAFLFANCKTHHNSSADIYFVPVEGHPFAISTISKGTQIRLIAFSGGKESTPETTYYDQFIGVTNSGDTIRVLTPLITTGEENTWTTPLLYNYDKGVDLATIQPEDSALYFGLNMYVRIKSSGDVSLNINPDFDKLKQKSNANERIVMVKGVPLFESPHYKTVIGGLHFDEVPW